MSDADEEKKDRKRKMEGKCHQWRGNTQPFMHSVSRRRQAPKFRMQHRQCVDSLKPRGAAFVILNSHEPFWESTVASPAWQHAGYRTSAARKVST